MNAPYFAKKTNLVKFLALALSCYLWALVPTHADTNAQAEATNATAENSTVQVDLTETAEAATNAVEETASEAQEAVETQVEAVAETAETQMVEQLTTDPAEAAEATDAAAETSEAAVENMEAAEETKAKITGVLQATEEGQAAETKIQESVVADSFKVENDEEKRKLLDEELQDLKKDILETNRDLFILEEDLLFPSSTQIKVFFSIDVGEYFKLDSVTLKLNNKNITHHLYTEREVDALSRGAVQRLVTENITSGKHELVATILGFGPKGREYRRAAAFEFEKSTGAKYIHLTIKADSTKQQPEFAFKEWD